MLSQPYLNKPSVSIQPEGVLNIDKPTDITSHDVVQQVRRVAGLRRVGHAGTLDPLATGVLVVCLGRATRLVEYVVGRPKRYVATIRLGRVTDTYDADGEVVQERPFAHLTPSDIAAALDPFRGHIQQQPPMYSAIKKDGKPLYELARQGIEVERKSRRVTIYHLTLDDVALPHITITVGCSTGTYVRSLAHDLGAALGCGGHITALRRTAVGDFTAETAVSLDTLTPDTLSHHLHPIDRAVHHLPRVTLPADDARALLHGQIVPGQNHTADTALARAYDQTGQFLGIVTGTPKGWQPRKMFPVSD